MAHSSVVHLLCHFCLQVLYKSRCDNRLNEITERALADKREVFANTHRITTLLFSNNGIPLIS